METTQNNTSQKIILGARKTGTFSAVKIPSSDVIAEPFPETRLLKWHPLTTPAMPPAASLVVTQDVLKAVCQHVAADLAREYGGFLFGNRYQCPQSGREYVLIDDYYKAEFTEGTSIQLVFTTDTWADLTDKRFTRFRGKLLVGWYHSHPKMDIFLSQDDVEVHQARFPEPWSCALVLEPEKGLGGFFVSHEGKLNCTSPVEFYEFCDHKAESSVIHWSNYSREETPAVPDMEPLPAIETLGAEVAYYADVETIEIVIPPDELPIIDNLGQSFPAWKAATAGLCAILLAVLGVAWLQTIFDQRTPLPVDKTEITQVVAPTPQASSSPVEAAPPSQSLAEQAIASLKAKAIATPVEVPVDKPAPNPPTPEKAAAKPPAMRKKETAAIPPPAKKPEASHKKKKEGAPAPQPEPAPAKTEVTAEPEPEKKPPVEGKPASAPLPATPGDKTKSDPKKDEKPAEEAGPTGKKGKANDSQGN